MYTSTRRRPLTAIITGYGGNPEGDITFLGTRWRVPRKPVGWHRFCLESIDLAGNESARRCAPIAFPRINPARPEVRRVEVTGGILLVELRLSDLPRGTSVRFDCRRGCDFHLRGTTGRRTSFARSFNDLPLDAGAVIELRAFKDRWTGYYAKITVRSKGIRKPCERPMAPGTTTPRGRCP